MRFTLHSESSNLLKEALESNCDGISFGAEFCEWKIPTLEVLKLAYKATKEAGKTFTYVTPILSNEGVKKLSKQLAFLKDIGDAEVIIGDLGLLNLLKDYPGLKLRLGRPRVYIPARCPWGQITRMPNPSLLTSLNVEKIFYQTSLNYLRTLEFYKNYGIFGADVDWIPKVFQHYKTIIKNGFNLSVHTHAIPVAITMKCHTARFLNEVGPALCTKPCLGKAFTIKQREVQRSYVLHGNVVFRLVESPQREVSELRKTGIEEMVIPMGSVSGLMTKKSLDDVITILSDGV